MGGHDFLTGMVNPLTLTLADDRTVEPFDEMGHGNSGVKVAADLVQSYAEAAGHVVGQGESEEVPVAPQNMGGGETTKTELTSEEIEQLKAKVQEIWKTISERRIMRTQGVKGIVKFILDYKSDPNVKKLAQQPVRADASAMEEILSQHNESDHELIKRFITEENGVSVFLNRRSLAIEVPSYIYQHKVRVELRNRILRAMGVNTDDKESPIYEEKYKELQNRKFSTKDLLDILIVQIEVPVEEVRSLALGVSSDILPEKVKETLDLFLGLTDEQILRGDVLEDSSPRPKTIRKSVTNMMRHHFKQKK